MAVIFLAGLFRYHDSEVEVDYTPELKAELIGVLDEMREALTSKEVRRSHDKARRCSSCFMR